MALRSSGVCALSLLSLCGCSCGHAQPSIEQSGPDTAIASVADSRVDSASARDSALDVAAESDGAAPDAPFAGTWQPIPGAPPECGTILASTPELSAPALGWHPCATGRSGCQELTVDWTTNLAGSLGFGDGPVRSIGGTPYMVLARIWPDDRGNPIHAVQSVQPLDGAAVFALRFSATATYVDGCAFSIAAGDSGIAMIGGPVGSGSAFSGDDFVAWSTWSHPNDLRFDILTHADELAPSGAGVSLIYGGSTLFIQTTAPRAIIPFDVGTLRLAKSNVLAEHQVAVRDGALAVSTGDPIGLLLFAPDATSAYLVHPESGRVITQQAIDRSAGDQIVWIESDISGFDYIHPTIWTSPYATTELAIMRRKVAVFSQDDPNGGAGMVVNNGLALNLTSASTALLTRLSDGFGWKIDAEPGEAFALPLWADDKEVWLATADPKLPSFKTHISGILRIDLAALGGPTVPPGI